MEQRHQQLARGISRHGTVMQLLILVLLVSPGWNIACHVSGTSRENTSSGNRMSINKRAIFWGTVQSVVSVYKFDGEMVPVDRVPSFVVVVRTGDDIPMIKRRAGDTINFGVHSVAKRFLEVDIVGKSYRFEIEKDGDGRIHLSVQ